MENFDNITDTFIESGKILGYNFNPVISKFIIENSFSKKKKILDIFKKHKNYDERGQVKIPIEVNQNISQYIINSFLSRLNDIINFYYSELCFDSSSSNIKEIKKIIELFRSPSSFTDKSFSDSYNTILSRIKFKQCPSNIYYKNYKKDETIEFPLIKEGEKKSHLMQKFLLLLGIDTQKDYIKKHYIKYSEEINKKTIPYHLYLSINPSRFLYISFGNSWTSCMSTDINNKLFKTNNFNITNAHYILRYMNDSSTFTAYLLKNNHHYGFPEVVPMVYRCLFSFYSGYLIQMRLYPEKSFNIDSNIMTSIRSAVQDLICQSLGLENKWKFTDNHIYINSNKSNTAKTIIIDNKNQNRPACFRLLSSPEPSVLDENFETLRFGQKKAICPICGNDIHFSSYIVCDKCSKELKN